MSFFQIGKQSVLFDEMQQTLSEIDAPAAAILRFLQEPRGNKPLPTLYKCLAAAGCSEDRARSTLEHLIGQGVFRF